MSDKLEAAIEETEDAIEETRGRVRARIDRLQRDLSPSAILDDLIPEGQTASETIRDVADAARRNPVATALIAGGVLLLGRDILSGRTAERVDAAADHGSDAAARIGRRARDLRSAANEAAGDLREQASQAYDAALDTAASARRSVTAAARTGREGIEDALDSTGRQVRRTARDARRAAQYGQRWVEENPVAAGLACVAAGALAASFFTARPVDYPETDTDGGSRPDASSGAKSPAKRRTTKTRAAGSKTAKTSRPAAKKATAASKAAAGKARARRGASAAGTNGLSAIGYGATSETAGRAP